MLDSLFPAGMSLISAVPVCEIIQWRHVRSIVRYFASRYRDEIERHDVQAHSEL